MAIQETIGFSTFWISLIFQLGFYLFILLSSFCDSTFVLNYASPKFVWRWQPEEKTWMKLSLYTHIYMENKQDFGYATVVTIR